MIDREMLENAARDYNRDKYSEEFYNYHLEALQNAQDINESVSRAVKYLFLWKLGKVRSKPTPSSSKLEFWDSEGRRYYSIDMTKSHHEIIKKAIESERLKIAISFRNRKISYDKFRPFASELTTGTIVLPAFYVHIWRPNEYPILDEKVWKVFCVEKEQPVSRHTVPRSWGDFEDYINFFNKLVDDTGLDRRTVDRGLWVLGGRLKERLRNEFQYEETSAGFNEQQEELNYTTIPYNLLNQACCAIGQKVGNVPFRYRGVMITKELVKVTMELLNAEPTKTLPQNCRNDVRERTPDGLDKRLKEYLKTDLRMANIISDVLEKSGIVEVVQVRNPQTGRTVKGTKLLPEWSW